MRLLALILAVITAPVSAVEISNFRSGLSCHGASPDGRSGWICQPTERVLVTDQGMCRYNREDHPCTWVGFEFEFQRAKPGTELRCTVTQSAPGEFGNPEGKSAEPTTEQEFALPLESAEGRFFNPQYFLYAARPAGNNTLDVEGRCSFEGEDLFRYRYHLVFPEALAPQPAPNNSSKPTPLRGAA
jgi:hypothetical protein